MSGCAFNCNLVLWDHLPNSIRNDPSTKHQISKNSNGKKLNSRDTKATDQLKSNQVQ